MTPRARPSGSEIARPGPCSAAAWSRWIRYAGVTVVARAIGRYEEARPRAVADRLRQLEQWRR